MVAIFYFIILYVFALFAERINANQKRQVLILICIILASFAGIRDYHWHDTAGYVMFFEDYTPKIFDLTSSDRPVGYREQGFFVLSSIIKGFSSSVTVYFLAIASLSFFFLYKSFHKYCYYPLLGVCAYVARFYFPRNYMQIRAGLSYAIVLMAVQYITNRDWKRYFAWVFVAYLFHHSALVAVPVYFLNMVNIKKRHIVMGLGAAFIIAGYFSNVVRVLVADNATDLDVTTYVTEQYQNEWGLSNPMIYFQMFLLLFYTFAENRMKSTTSHYITIRNAYFYSTLILITLSCYTALSGRVSSMFATLEMVIIPSLAFSFFKKDRWIAFFVMGFALAVIYYYNYTR